MKYLCNVAIDFMDGTHAAPGETVDVDPAKVTDLADLEAVVIDGQAALVKVDEPAPVDIAGIPSSLKTSKFIKSTVTMSTSSDVTPPAQEDVTNG